MPALFVTAAVGGGGSFLTWLSTWASTGVFLVGALLGFWRARAVEVDRAAWVCFGVASACWAGANLYYALVVAPGALPLPSPADIGYFGFPVAVGAGLVLYARPRLRRIPVDVGLDGAIAALGTAAFISGLVFSFVDVRTADVGSIVTSFLYPLEDVAVLGVLVGVSSLAAWRLDRTLTMIAVAVVSITAADMVTFTQVLGGSAVGGALTNLGWTVGIGLIAAAARLGPHEQKRMSDRRHAHDPPRDRLGLPVAFGFVALTVLALAGPLHLSPVASICAVAALAVSGVRLRLSFHEVRALAESRRLAFTDELTELPNRRQLLRDLEAACARRTPRLLAILDLDGFKQFNDTYGHPDGDRLLFDFSTRLAAAVSQTGLAYRLGGDEFCVLALPADGNRVLEQAAGALTGQGPGWSIGVSVGVVEIPREADSVPSAMRIADRRMYAQKERRPVAARQQARAVLLSALSEQQPALSAHARDVTEWARDVAIRLGMAPDEIDDVIRAAELHDVGKLAIPREILDKPTALNDDEWKLMRQHTIIGERMLNSAPALKQIAPLVRSTHERWAGGGYPDALAGTDIPFAARIVAVCDAFDAMVADRPYRAAMSTKDAIAELRRCAGTQFDPDVVDAFLEVLVWQPLSSEPVPSNAVNPLLTTT